MINKVFMWTQGIRKINVLGQSAKDAGLGGVVA